MARPSIYNWEAIKEAYEAGFDRDEICKNHRVTPKILSNRINKEGWTVKGNIKSDILGLSEHIHKTAQNIDSLHEINQEMAISRVVTIEADNELISNNRKIAKLLQSVIVSNRDAITLANIRNVSGTLKDIESIANPQTSKTEINNTNATQNNTEVKRVSIVRRSDRA